MTYAGMAGTLRSTHARVLRGCQVALDLAIGPAQPLGDRLPGPGCAHREQGTTVGGCEPADESRHLTNPARSAAWQTPAALPGLRTCTSPSAGHAPAPHCASTRTTTRPRSASTPPPSSGAFVTVVCTLGLRSGPQLPRS